MKSEASRYVRSWSVRVLDCAYAVVITSVYTLITPVLSAVKVPNLESGIFLFIYFLG